MNQFQFENELCREKERQWEKDSYDSDRARFRGRHLHCPNLLSAHHFLGSHFTLTSMYRVPTSNLSDCILYYLAGTQPKVHREQ